MDNYTTEQWKAIAGHEGSYEVSDHGRVRSLDRHVICGQNGATRLVKGRILSPGVRLGGYLVVNLGKGNHRRVHHLVAEAFIGPRAQGVDVCHRDCDPTNNHVANLRYDTRAGNMADTVAAGRSNRGERGPNHVLRESDVREMRAKWVPRKYTVKMLASEYGYPESAVALAVRRTGNSGTWQWLA